MNPLQAVLFDMDGLFVDTEHSWFEAQLVVMADLGGAWGDSDAAAMVGTSLAQSARFMVDRAGRGDPARVEQHLIDVMAALLEAGADHRPGADELLEDLVTAGVPCALVSSSPRILVNAALDSVGGDRFAFTIAGDEVTRLKPFPDPYLEAVRRLGVDPARTIVLEDSPTGVAAGEAAGCCVVAVPYALPIEAAPGRVVVESLSDLTAAHLAALLEGPAGSPVTRW